MTTLNIRPDDTGLQSIKRTAGAATASPAPLSPSAPSTAIHSEARQPLPAIEQRRERRKGERRKRNLPVLLDTRSQRDRRRNGVDADTGPTGIDIYV